MQPIPDNVLAAARQAAISLLDAREERDRAGHVEYLCNTHGCTDHIALVRQLGEWLAAEFKRRDSASYERGRQAVAPANPDIGNAFDT